MCTRWFCGAFTASWWSSRVRPVHQGATTCVQHVKHARNFGQHEGKERRTERNAAVAGSGAPPRLNGMPWRGWSMMRLIRLARPARPSQRLSTRCVSAFWSSMTACTLLTASIFDKVAGGPDGGQGGLRRLRVGQGGKGKQGDHAHSSVVAREQCGLWPTFRTTQHDAASAERRVAPAPTPASRGIQPRQERMRAERSARAGDAYTAPERGC